MEFEAAAPWWWRPAGMVVGVVLAVAMWNQATRQYSGAPFKRNFFRLFSVLVGITLPIVMFLANTETFRVQGDEVRVRGDFERGLRAYAASDIVSWNLERVGGGGGTRGGGTRHTELVVHFRDGYRVGISEKYRNYDRLRGWLEARGVERR